MTTLPETQPVATTPAEVLPAGTRLLSSNAFWGTVAILMMWLAVLFVGVYAGDMNFHSNDGNFSTIPSVVAVALFAAIGTGSVAKRVYSTKR